MNAIKIIKNIWLGSISCLTIFMLLCLLAFFALPSIAYAQSESSEIKQVIRINKYVLGKYSSYQLLVFSNGQVEFGGIDTRVTGVHKFKITDEQYRRALKVFDDIDFAKLESHPLTMIGHAIAAVSLDRDGVRKSVNFPSAGGTGREYAILITSLEEILRLHELICPRWSMTYGDKEDLCAYEARIMDQDIKGER